MPPYLIKRIEDLPEFQIDWEAEDDEQAKSKANALAQRKEDVAYLYAFEDWSVPRGWQFPESLRYGGVEPRDGDEGRKLDWIQYELLSSANDFAKAQRAMFGVTAEEVEAASKSFRAAGGVLERLKKIFT